VDELLKSQAERHTERANNVKRLLLIDSEACSDLGAKLKAEAERGFMKRRRWNACAGSVRAAMTKPLRYVVLLGRDGDPPYLYDTETKTRIMSYRTVREAERQAILLNRCIFPGVPDDGYLDKVAIPNET
jgi:hypothetical protein